MSRSIGRIIALNGEIPMYESLIVAPSYGEFCSSISPKVLSETTIEKSKKLFFLELLKVFEGDLFIKLLINIEIFSAEIRLFVNKSYTRKIWFEFERTLLKDFNWLNDYTNLENLSALRKSFEKAPSLNEIENVFDIFLLELINKVALNNGNYQKYLALLRKNANRSPLESTEQMSNEATSSNNQFYEIIAQTSISGDESLEGLRLFIRSKLFFQNLRMFQLAVNKNLMFKY